MLLQKAVQLEPGNARYAYVLAVALNSIGQSEAAIRTLTDARLQFPDDYDIGWALATILRDTGETDSALELIRQMRQDYPEDQNLESLESSLRSSIRSAPTP